MRAHLLMWFVVAGYAAGICTAFLIAHLFFSVPIVANSDFHGTFLTSAGIILAIDPANHTLTIDMVSPYSIREHAPFRVVYSGKTSILIGNGRAFGDGYATALGTPSDLAVGQSVRITMPRRPGPLSVDRINSL